MLFGIICILLPLLLWVVIVAKIPALDRAHEKKMIARRSDGKEVELKPAVAIEPVASNDPTMCSLYEVRLTQQKMVDAGIIKQWELSNCDNEDCDNCYIMDPMRRYSGKKIPRFTEPRQMLEPKKFSDRTKVIRGETVNIPEGVPDHAHADLKPRHDNFFEILWTWQREVDGKRMGLKSVHPRKGAFAPRYSRPNVKSSKAIEKIRQDNKKLKEMLDETKRLSEEYRKAASARRVNRGQCECTEEIIESGNGDMISLKFKTCEYHKTKAVKEALAESPVRRRSTGDMGPVCYD